MFQGDLVSDVVGVIFTLYFIDNDLLYDLQILEGIIQAMAVVNSPFIDSRKRRVSSITSRKTMLRHGRRQDRSNE